MGIARFASQEVETLALKKLATIFLEDCTLQQLVETTRSEAHPIAVGDMEACEKCKSW
jgi:hypothetical protein